MNKKRSIFSVACLFFISFNAFGQQIIRGTVLENTGTPISEATIEIKGKNDKITTSLDGVFEINAQKGEVLVISAQGMKTQEVKINNQTELNILLSTASQSLEEITVVGALGIRKSKASQGYTTQVVSGDAIADSNRSNFANALQGRVAGMSVTSTSGAPGASATIQLRGVNSISGNNSPLYVIDGLPINNSTLSQGSLVSNQANRQQDYSNRGADVNPEDIESITILKGPEAAALYGIQAGNGAIVITTKKGKRGEGRINYSYNTRVEQMYLFPETQKVYGRGGTNVSSINSTNFFGAKYGAEEKIYNNLENFFQTGISNQHSLTYEKGNDKSTYRLSFNHLDQKGTIPTTAFKKINASLGASSQINDHLKSEGYMSYTKSETDKVARGADGTFLSVLFHPANDDMTNYLNPDGSRRRLLPSLRNEPDNPYWAINKNPSKDEVNRFIGNVALIYDPLKWLNFTARLGTDYTGENGFRAAHGQSYASVIAGGTAGGFIENYQGQTTNFNYILHGSAKHEIGKFNGKLLFGHSMDDLSSRILSASGSNFVSPDFISINNTTPLNRQVKDAFVRMRTFGTFGEISLDYDKMIFLNATGRYDVTSTLPEGNNGFFYPSLSTSFVFTKIKALEGKKILSFGKLRASYAEGARIPDAYQLLAALDLRTTTGSGYSYGFSANDVNLLPEIRSSYEFGTELKFLNNRIGLDFSYYKSTTNDPLLKDIRKSYASYTILSSMNIGKLQNTGIEIMLTANPIKNDNFKWDAFVNFTKTNSKMLSLPNEIREFYLPETWMVGNARNGIMRGGSLTTFTGNTYLKNDRGDILIDPTTGLALKDTSFTIIGDKNPDFMIGLGNNFTYKNLTFSFLFDIRKGGDVFNGTEFALYRAGLSKNTLDRDKTIVMKGVVRDGLENTSNPTINNIEVRPEFQNGYYTGAMESDFIEKDINWLKLKEISLTYRMSNNFLSSIKYIKSLSFNFTMTDLFMITNYTGADPSVSGLSSAVGGTGGVGFDYGTFSTPRTFSFGVNLGL